MGSVGRGSIARLSGARIQLFYARDRLAPFSGSVDPVATLPYLFTDGFEQRVFDSESADGNPLYPYAAGVFGSDRLRPDDPAANP